MHDSFGVDHIKSNAISTLKTVDLTTQHGQKVFLGWLESPLVQGIFIAPPCGTCSLARCIKLRDEKGRPIPGPVPLRSEKFPEGLPNLSPRNRLRVSLANKLYEFVGRVIRLAHKRGLIIAVENPRSSLFWATRWWRECGVPMQYTAHQACAYGSDRPKWTVVQHNRKQFMKLNRCCPGESKEHRHQPWGRTENNSFATSEETNGLSHPPCRCHRIRIRRSTGKSRLDSTSHIVRSAMGQYDFVACSGGIRKSAKSIENSPIN